MPSLIDIFNPSFLIFLGIMVLVVALLVVYFESKMREQNHKISSMLSLVSAMAEEVNIIRSNASISSVGGSMNTNKIPFEFNPQIDISENTEDNKSLIFSENKLDLIAVSDDEDSASDSGSDEDDDDDDDSDDDDDDDSVDSNFIELLQQQSILIHDESHDIKILKINIDNFDKDIAGIREDLNECNDINDLEDVNDVFSDSDNEIEDIHLSSEQLNNNTHSLLENKVIIIDDVNDLNEIDGINENDVNGLDDDNNISISQEIPSDLDLKSINISDLEEIKNNNESVDYKKLSLNKLRSVVLEKNLAVDSSKLKKQELLKLLGAE
jgi:hypothetical protein